MKGFTLIELLVVVAILGIIAAIATPHFQGYSSTANNSIAQNNLRSIYMQQQEYFLNNNVYYFTDAACDDDATAINTNLFDGKTILPAATEGFEYCILQTTTADFTARAEDTSSTDAFTIDENNVTNF